MTIASLSVSIIRVEPAQEAHIDLTVRNSGTVVDEFTFDILGDSAPWTSVQPTSISLFPGAEGTTRLTFRPPRDYAVGAGPVPFGVRVASREDPNGTVVEEGTVEVGVFADNFAELIPRTVRGRRTGRYDVAVDNRGNALLNASLEPVEPDRQLSFRFSPPSLAIPAGAAAFSRIQVHPRRRHLSGPDQTRTFQVRVTPNDGAPPLLAAGTFLQEPLLPRWSGKLLAALVAAAVVLAVLWFTVLRPAIRSQAKDAAKNETAALSAQVANAQQAATAALAATKASIGGGGPPAPAPAPAAGPATTATGGRVALNVPPGQSGSQNLPGLPPNKSFNLTDVVFENPNGDLGILQLKRGNDVVLQLSLTNFRDLDYHFIAPVVFPKGQAATLQVQCQNTNNQPCQPAAYLAGYLS